MSQFRNSQILILEIDDDCLKHSTTAANLNASLFWQNRIGIRHIYNLNYDCTIKISNKLIQAFKKNVWKSYILKNDKCYICSSLQHSLFLVC